MDASSNYSKKKDKHEYVGFIPNFDKLSIFKYEIKSIIIQDYFYTNFIQINPFWPKFCTTATPFVRPCLS